MKTLNVTSENFASIRETLKSGEAVNVNNVVTLNSFIANTERVNESGKKTRTPFYYVADNGTKYTSTTLKALLGIEAETKSERKETTFAMLWEQCSKLAEKASYKELHEAIETLKPLAESAKKAEAKAKADEIAALKARLAELEK